MLKIGKGETLELQVSQLDDNGDPVDFTSHSIELSVWVEDATTHMYAQTYTGDTEGFTVKVEETVTANWSPGEYIYLITDTFTDPFGLPTQPDIKWVVQDRLLVKGPSSLG